VAPLVILHSVYAVINVQAWVMMDAKVDIILMIVVLAQCRVETIDPRAANATTGNMISFVIKE